MTSFLSNDPSEERPKAKLVVTFFANARSSQETFLSQVDVHGRAGHNVTSSSLSSIVEPPFTKLLTTVISPARSVRSSSQTFSPHVFQTTYIISPLLLDPSFLRHNASISAFEQAHSVEIVFDLLPNPIDSHRPIQLAIFDMDSTLINEEVIDELARSIGVTAAVSTITKQAINGELDFEQSLRARLMLLKGVKSDVWSDLEKSLSIATGARELCKELQRRGVITAVASGGFAPMAEWLKDQLGLDYAFANHVRQASYFLTAFWTLSATKFLFFHSESESDSDHS